MKTDPRADEWAARYFGRDHPLTDDELRLSRESSFYAHVLFNLALRDFGRVFASENGLEAIAAWLTKLVRTIQNLFSRGRH